HHQSPEWPEGYWPKEAAPSSEEEWNECLKKIESDRDSFIGLLENAGENLYIPFKHGTGQSLLKEALVLADHNSYHTGEILVLRRLLDDWK
ncbi:MAG: DinB family protein, partial [Ginsengibacter sp.]